MRRQRESAREMELSRPEDIPLDWTRNRSAGAGYVNLGNTCFMNAVLQILTHTAPLAEYCLDNTNGLKSTTRKYLPQHHRPGSSSSNHSASHSSGREGSSSPHSFCPVETLHGHVGAATEGSGHRIKPSTFARNLKAIHRSFRLGRQEDSHEFLRCLLDKLHEASFKHLKPKPSQTVQDSSWVSRIFGGRLRSQVKCLECGYESNKYDPCMDISLEIPRSGDLRRALSHFIKGEVLDGDNKYNCPNEKKASRAIKSLCIEQLPYVLTIHLKRFEFGGFGAKIGRHVEFPETLDMASFTVASGGGGGGDKHQSKGAGRRYLYHLYGVLVHAGHSLNSGHYYSYVKAANGSWYCCDDCSVSPSSIQTVLNQKAYILFYRKDSPCGTHVSRSPSKSRKEELQDGDSQRRSTSRGKGRMTTDNHHHHDDEEEEEEEEEDDDEDDRATARQLATKAVIGKQHHPGTSNGTSLYGSIATRVAGVATTMSNGPKNGNRGDRVEQHQQKHREEEEEEEEEEGEQKRRRILRATTQTTSRPMQEGRNSTARMLQDQQHQVRSRQQHLPRALSPPLTRLRHGPDSTRVLDDHHHHQQQQQQIGLSARAGDSRASKRLRVGGISIDTPQRRSVTNLEEEEDVMVLRRKTTTKTKITADPTSRRHELPLDVDVSPRSTRRLQRARLGPSKGGEAVVATLSRVRRQASTSTSPPSATGRPTRDRGQDSAAVDGDGDDGGGKEDDRRRRLTLVEGVAGMLAGLDPQHHTGGVAGAAAAAAVAEFRRQHRLQKQVYRRYVYQKMHAKLGSMSAGRLAQTKVLLFKVLQQKGLHQQISAAYRRGNKDLARRLARTPAKEEIEKMMGGSITDRDHREPAAALTVAEKRLPLVNVVTETRKGNSAPPTDLSKVQRRTSRAAKSGPLVRASLVEDKEDGMMGKKKKQKRAKKKTGVEEERNRKVDEVIHEVENHGPMLTRQGVNAILDTVVAAASDETVVRIMKAAGGEDTTRSDHKNDGGGRGGTPREVELDRSLKSSSARRHEEMVVNNTEGNEGSGVGGVKKKNNNKNKVGSKPMSGAAALRTLAHVGTNVGVWGSSDGEEEKEEEEAGWTRTRRTQRVLGRNGILSTDGQRDVGVKKRTRVYDEYDAEYDKGKVKKVRKKFDDDEDGTGGDRRRGSATLRGHLDRAAEENVKHRISGGYMNDLHQDRKTRKNQQSGGRSRRPAGKARGGGGGRGRGRGRAPARYRD